jgi:chorismate dehydratase
LNAAPFVYGLQAKDFKDYITLMLMPPAQCAESFAAAHVDAALIPVGALGQCNDYQIVSDYCIGASENVYSVCLFANEPINMLNSVYLDTDSRTSAKLVQILMQEYWHVSPTFIPLQMDSLTNFNKKGVGFLLIGDKTFDCRSHFSHIYDMAQAWKNHTGLPFVFAVWVAKNGINHADITLINKALSYGVNCIPQVAAQRQPYYEIDVERYLTQYIDYDFDAMKKQGMHLFLTKINA